MTRNEVVEAVADYFGIDYPEKDEDGQYICEGYEWEAGCYGRNRWMSLASFIEAIDEYNDGNIEYFEAYDDGMAD